MRAVSPARSRPQRMTHLQEMTHSKQMLTMVLNVTKSVQLRMICYWAQQDTMIKHQPFSGHHIGSLFQGCMGDFSNMFELRKYQVATKPSHVSHVRDVEWSTVLPTRGNNIGNRFRKNTSCIFWAMCAFVVIHFMFEQVPGTLSLVSIYHCSLALVENM